MHAKIKLIFLSLFIFIIIGTVFISGCNLRCLTVPSCWMAPGPTTKIWTNNYYVKHFIKTDTLLSTKYFYEMTDTTESEINSGHKRQNKSFLFYPNGLVLENDYNLDNPNADTIHTFTQDLKYACCHAWTIGSYKISNDTINFATKSGEMKYWQYYRGKISDSSIQIFEEIQGDKKDYSFKDFKMRDDKVVIKDIRIR